VDKNEDGTDIAVLEKSFNDELDSFRKSLGLEDSEDGTLEKAKKDDKKKSDVDYDEGADVDEEVEEEEDDEEAKGVKKSVDAEDSFEILEKSVEDMMSDDEEAEAAMDVAPFLGQLVKSIDVRFNELSKAISKKLNHMETLAKSQGRVIVTQAELMKAQTDMVERMGNQTMKTAGIKRFQKSRFGDEGEKTEVNTQEVLNKSLGWLQKGKINHLEAGQIENRANKGILGTVNDNLDKKIAALVKEAS